MPRFITPVQQAHGVTHEPDGTDEIRQLVSYRIYKPSTVTTEVADTTEYTTTSTTYVLLASYTLTDRKIRKIQFDVRGTYGGYVRCKITLYYNTTEYTLKEVSIPNTTYTTFSTSIYSMPGGTIRVYACVEVDGEIVYVRNIYVYTYSPYYTLTRSSSANIVVFIGKANNYSYLLYDSIAGLMTFTTPTTDTTFIQFTSTNIMFLTVDTDMIVLFSGVV